MRCDGNRGCYAACALGARERHDPRDIDDQSDATVIQNRATGNARDLANALAEGLGDHLLLTKELIDQQRHAMFTITDDHEDRIRRRGDSIRNPEHLVQTQHRQHFAAQHDHFATRRNRGQHSGFRSEAQRDTGEWHDVTFFAHANQHTIGHGECERQADLERGALTEHGVDVDAAANGLDVPAYHIHAHTSPRDVSDLFGRAEAWREDERVDLGVSH
jgi:hypothetical protein